MCFLWWILRTWMTRLLVWSHLMQSQIQIILRARHQHLLRQFSAASSSQLNMELLETVSAATTHFILQKFPSFYDEFLSPNTVAKRIDRAAFLNKIKQQGSAISQSVGEKYQLYVNTVDGVYQSLALAHQRFNTQMFDGSFASELIEAAQDILAPYLDHLVFPSF